MGGRGAWSSTPTLTHPTLAQAGPAAVLHQARAHMLHVRCRSQREARDRVCRWEKPSSCVVGLQGLATKQWYVHKGLYDHVVFAAGVCLGSTFQPVTSYHPYLATQPNIILIPIQPNTKPIPMPTPLPVLHATAHHNIVWFSAYFSKS